MKYIIDIDALKDCLDLLPTSYSDVGCVYLGDVKKWLIGNKSKQSFKASISIIYFIIYSSFWYQLQYL